MRRHSLLLGVLAVVGLLCGCAATPTTNFASLDTTSVSSTTPANTTAATPEYRVGPLDVLDVSVFQVPDLSKTVQVSAQGQITLPLIGAVQAGGKTINELQNDIASKYGATYLQSPQVSVFVHEALSQRITVNGEVNKPGVYPTAGPTTLLQSVAIAGGTTDLADMSGVVVLRQIEGKRQAAKFDLAAIQAGRAQDPLLQGGDTIIVDKSGLKAAFSNVRQAIPIFGAFVPLL